MSEQPQQQDKPPAETPDDGYVPPFVEDVESGPEPDPPPPPFTESVESEPDEIKEPVMPFTGEEEA